MEKIKQVFKNNMRQYAMLIALVVIIILFEILTKGILLQPQNVSNMIQQYTYVWIMAIGMMLCILTGGNIDLSVGSVCAFISAMMGTLVIVNKMNFLPAIIIGLLMGCVIGAWQGFWIAYVRIPAFIVTLAGMLIFRGLTLVLLKGLTLAPFPEPYRMLGAGFVPDIFNVEHLNVLTLIVGVLVSILYIIIAARSRSRKQKYGFEVSSFGLFLVQIILIVAVINVFMYTLACYKGMPSVLIILAILITAYSYFTIKMVPGRYIYAMGGNEKAAKLSGIDTNKVLFFVYLNMAVGASLAGIVFSARINSASPQAGQSFELDAIASCFIGGASATGGVGTVIGAIIGGLVMCVLNNGMSIVGVGIDWQQVIKGLILLFFVAFDVYSKTRSTKA